MPRITSNDGGVYWAVITSAAPIGTANLVWEQPLVGPHAEWLFGMAGVDQPGADAEDIYFGTQDIGSFANIQAGADVTNNNWHNANCCDAFDFGADNDTVVYSLGATSPRVFPFRLGDRGMVNTPQFDDPADYPNAGTTTPAFNFSESVANWGDDRYAILMNDGGGNDGGLFITTDITPAGGGGSSVSWTELGNATEPASNNYADLQVAFDGGGTPSFFVTVGDGNGYTADQLWRFDGTNPAGVWQRIDTNIGGGADGVGVFAVDPNNPNRLYASAIDLATGPWMVSSADGGTTWSPDTYLDAMMTGAGAFQYAPQRGPRNFPDQENSGAPARRGNVLPAHLAGI